MIHIRDCLPIKMDRELVKLLDIKELEEVVKHGWYL